MLLALDIATVTGHARLTKDGIVFGTADFSAFDHDHAVKGRRLYWWLWDLIKEHGKPSIIIIEKPYFDRRYPEAGILLHKLCHDAHRVAECLKIPRIEYTAGQAKKHVTGNGKASKTDVIQAVEKLGHKIRNEHEADSVALLLLHKHNLGE